jgi:hypothetical protein
MVYGHLEFWTMKGEILIIQKALYGLKSSGAAWRAMFSMTFHELGYMLVKPNGAQYYEMLLVYVDDILHSTHHKAFDQNETMKETRRIYQLIGCASDEDGNNMLFLSVADNIDGALKTVTADLPKDTKLKGKADQPFIISYHAELDATPHLDTKLVQQYQG